MNGEKSVTVSIGFAVYNGEALMRTALDSLLQQDFKDFELIICDNASTDNTWAICQSYAAKDSRISLHRNTKNIGAIPNFNRVFELATGKYFMWAAHDDEWDKAFIGECVRALDADPKSALCYVQHIHRDPVHQTAVPSNLCDLQLPSEWQRVRALLLCWPPPNIMIYGLFRRDILVEAMPIVFGTGAPDSIVLLRVAMLGNLVYVDKPLHFYTYVRRDMKTRLRQMQFPGKWPLLIVFNSDMLLANTLLKIIRLAATNRESWIKLLGAAIIFFYRMTGWPLSLRLFARYLYLILPDSITNWIERIKTKPVNIESDVN